MLGGIDGVNGGKTVSVGIGTTQPATRFEVVGGDIYIGSSGRGVIRKTITGSNWARLVVNDQGQVSAPIITGPGSSAL